MDKIFSISIPTYNRAKLLKRNLVNLEMLHFDKRLFEIIIVDDGSTDNTEEMIEDYMKYTELDIRYVKKENGGKFSALNVAIDMAEGILFINCDSDDYLDINCLARLKSIWDAIGDKTNIAGIIGHNFDITKKQISGNLFPKDNMLSDPIEMRFKYNISGDKFPCVLSSIMKEYKFPQVNGKTKFIPESYILYGVSFRYSFLYVNVVLQNCEYQIGGLTNNISNYRVNNSYGCYLVYRRYIELFNYEKSLKGYVRNYLNYIRFSIHVKKYKFITSNVFDYLLMPLGTILYFIDIIRYKRAN